MNEKARPTGTQAGFIGRQPGWFACRPAMTLLSKPLRIFSSLQPIVHRLSTWSHNLASRWLPRRPTGNAWRGRLDLSLHPGRAFSARRDMRRLPDIITGKQTSRGGLQTLSLPEGIRIEEPPEAEVEQPNLSTAEELAELPLPAPSEDLPLAAPGIQTISTSPGAPLDDLAATAADNLTISNSPAAPRETPLPRRILPASSSSPVQKVSRPAWPFRLVSLRAEKSQPGPSYISHGKMEVGARHTLQLPAAGASGGLGPPGKFLARSGLGSPGKFLAGSPLPQTEPENAPPRLAPRPMTSGQPPVITTQPPITVLEPGAGGGDAHAVRRALAAAHPAVHER